MTDMFKDSKKSSSNGDVAWFKNDTKHRFTRNPRWLSNPRWLTLALTFEFQSFLSHACLSLHHDMGEDNAFVLSQGRGRKQISSPMCISVPVSTTIHQSPKWLNCFPILVDSSLLDLTEIWGFSVAKSVATTTQGLQKCGTFPFEL